MEIFFLAIIATILYHGAQSGPFSPTYCAYCPRGIHWSNRQKAWIHDDGVQWHPWGSAMHPALPPR